LPDAVARHGMRWVHLAIRDASVPEERFEAGWATSGRALRSTLRRGGSVLIHCRGGLGRTGMVAARLLVEMGMDARAAIAAVRQARPGAIETGAQALHVLGCRRVIPERDEA
jgi:ADP-ribosyl-[dinitrogen reductase] hydrolase